MATKAAGETAITANNQSADGSYYDGKFETIEYIEHVVENLVKNGIEPKRAYCVGQALKYLSTRLGAKADNPVELDLQKAENYIHRARTGEWIDTSFLPPVAKAKKKA